MSTALRPKTDRKASLSQVLCFFLEDLHHMHRKYRFLSLESSLTGALVLTSNGARNEVILRVDWGLIVFKAPSALDKGAVSRLRSNLVVGTVVLGAEVCHEMSGEVQQRSCSTDT